MKMIYKDKFEVEAGMIDFNKSLALIPTLIKIQTLGTIAGNVSGISLYDKPKENKAWVISRLKVEFVNPISDHDIVNETTWINKPKASFTFDRYHSLNVKKKECVRAVSRWCIINTQTRALERLESISHIIPKNISDLGEINISFEKINIDDSFKLNHERIILLSELDINNHCNNVKYSEMALDCVDEAFKTRNLISYEINYIKETKYKDIISIYSKNNDTEVYVYGKNKLTDQVIFSAKFLYK